MKKQNTLKIILVILLLVLAGIGGYFYYDRVYKNRNIDQYKNSVREAKTLYELRDYSESLQKYTDATEEYESGHEAYIGIVTVLLDKNLDDKALEIAKSAEDRIDSQYMVDIYISIADFYYQNQEWQKAKQYYEKALTLGYSDYVKLGVIKSTLRSGSTDIKSDYWQTSSDTEVEVLFEKNLLFVLVKSLENDLTEIDPIIEKLDSQVGDIEQSVSLVETYQDLKVSFEEAVDNKDDKLYYKALFAKVALNQGYSVIAVELLEGAKIEEYWEGLYCLGRGYYGIGNYDKAIENLEKAVSAGTDKPEVYTYIARTYYLKKELNNSIEYYNRAITFADEEEKAEFYREYIELLYEQELYNQALSALEDLGKIEKDNWLNLAYLRIYYTIEDSEGIEKYLGAVNEEELIFKSSHTIFSKGGYTPYRFDSSLGTYYYYYIKYLLDNKNVADRDLKLDQLLEKYAQQDQTDPYYNYLHALYSLEQGDIENVRKFAGQAIEYDLEGKVSVKAKKLLAST